MKKSILLDNLNRHEVFDKSYKFHDGNSCQRMAELLKL